MKKIARYSVKNFKLLLAVYVIFVLFFGGAIIFRLIKDSSVIDNSVAIWFMQDDPELKIYDQYNETFGEQEWTVLMLKTESIYDSVFLEELSEITERVDDLKHVVKVNSITNIRDNDIKENEMLTYNRIYPGNNNITNENIKVFKKRLAENPIFNNSIFHIDDETTTVLLLQNENLIRKLEPYRIEMIDSIIAIVGNYPMISNYALAGTTVVNAELNRSSRRDVGIFYTVLSLMLLLFGWISMRSWKNIIAMFVVVVGSIIPTMGLIALCHIPYNMITVMMPTVLIALSVADVIHVIGYFHHLRRNSDPENAIEGTIKHLWEPGLWTTVTTIVGFTSLLFSTVYPIFQLGLFAAIGVAMALIVTLTIIPGLLVNLFPDRLISVTSGQPALSFVVKLPAFIRKYRYINYAFFMLLLFAASGIFSLKVDTNYTKFFGKNTRITRAYDDIKVNGYAQNPVTLVFQYPKGMDYTSSPYFPQIVQFEQMAAKFPDVIKILSVNDLLYQTDKAFMQEESSMMKFKNYNEDQLEQLLMLADMSNNDDIYDFLTYDKSQMQIQVLTNYKSSNELDIFKAKLSDLKNQIIADDVKMTFTGSTILWANMDKQISRTQFYSLIGVLIFLLVFFPLIFGSIKLGLLGVLVNVLPISITYGFMGLFGVEINMATAIIGGISLGIVTDDTIHFVHRFKYGLKKGLTTAQASASAITTTGKSIIMTSVILIGAFLTMTTSNFLPTSNFGLLISICIAVALFIDILVLPNILRQICKTTGSFKAMNRIESKIHVQGDEPAMGIEQF